MSNSSKRFDPPSKLTLHTQFADYMAGLPIYPINVEISPSGVCQASCQFCFYANTGELGSHRNVMLETPRTLKLLNELGMLGVKSVSWTGGGEPTLHPSFSMFVEELHSVGLHQGLFTNALAQPKYDPSKFDWIRVTMTDKPYQEDYIKELREATALGFAFNYSGPNDETYLLQTLELAERVGADYVQVRPALRFHGETVDIAPPTLQHRLLYVTDYKFEQAKVRHSYDRCEGYHLGCFIWEDGNVDTCAYMRKHDGYRLGNIYQSRLKDILDRAPDSVPVHTQCQVCCKLHETNLTIHAARELQDVNFP